MCRRINERVDVTSQSSYGRPSHRSTIRCCNDNICFTVAKTRGEDEIEMQTRHPEICCCFGRNAFGKQKRSEHLRFFTSTPRFVCPKQRRRKTLLVCQQQTQQKFLLSPEKNSNNWYNTKCLLNKLLIVTGERFFAVGDGVDGGKTVVIVIDTPKCNKIMSVTGSPTSALMWGRATAKRSTIS